MDFRRLALSIYGSREMDLGRMILAVPSSSHMRVCFWEAILNSDYFKRKFETSSANPQTLSFFICDTHHGKSDAGKRSLETVVTLFENSIDAPAGSTWLLNKQAAFSNCAHPLTNCASCRPDIMLASSHPNSGDYYPM
eukprot:Rmarinus@m.18427